VFEEPKAKEKEQGAISWKIKAKQEMEELLFSERLK